MRSLRFVAAWNFLLVAVLCVPLWGMNSGTSQTSPGTLNYVEGEVSIGKQSLNSKAVGSAELQPGQVLTTEKGKAEVLLTPGVFLRLGDNSRVKMISPSLTDTEVEVDQGHAMIEVEEIHPENSLRVNEDGTTTQLLKTGLYDFNRNQRVLRVFDGKAFVENGRDHVNVKSGRELTLVGNNVYKPHKFDKKSYEEGDLYRWSSLRSAYLAEANIDAASTYAETGWGGPGWWGADWYWDPWFDAFTFIPPDGIFFSPFGWGFYSPWWVFDAPFFGWYGYGGYGHFYHHFSTNYHNWGAGAHYVEGRNYAHGVYHGPGSMGGAFHSGPRMVASSYGFGRFGGGFRGGAGSRGSSVGFHGGGGFHGGEGGFHGGGGGGFHGR